MNPKMLPARQLRGHGIPVVADLPAVGLNLQARKPSEPHPNPELEDIPSTPRGRWAACEPALWHGVRRGAHC